MRLITFSFLFFCCINSSGINAQCSSNISSIKVYQESFSTGSTVDDIPNGLKLDGGGHLCTDFASMIDGPEMFGSDIDITQGTNTSAKRQAMVFYHISAARAWANTNLPSSLISALDGNLEFKVEDVGKALFMVDKPLKATIDYRKRDMNDPGGDAYNAFAEDAFAIASGYFQAAHINSLVFQINEKDTELPQDEGVLFSISDYLAYRYMSSKGYNTGTQMYVHAGIGSDDWVTLDIDFSKIDIKYSSLEFDNQKSQKQSELLSAALNHLTILLNADGNGKSKVDAMVVDALVNLNNNKVNNQGDAVKILYSQAVTNGLDELDLCIILEFFTEVYGNAFFDEENTYIPPSSDGDIYIKDNTGDNGTESSTGAFTNSPSIWNRHMPNDFTPDHQDPYGSGAPTKQYVNVAIDGSFCDIQGLVKLIGDVNYKIYRAVPKLGYQWPIDWNNTSLHNAPEGDLIGTFYVKDPQNGNAPTFRDDLGDIVLGWSYSNEGNLLILSLPWDVPDYLWDVWLPNISPKGNSVLGISFQDAFLVRVESTQYDPITPMPVEVANVYTNVVNKNNIAMKTSNITIAYEHESTGGTPGTLLPNDDDDPTDIIIKLDPSTHDPVRPIPDPTDPEPFTPVLPEFNNFMDYGEARIVLDEDTHLDWAANGSQGNGFVVNATNEIIVTASDFTLRGIPRSVSGGQIRAMGVRFYAANGILTSRTGFDVVAENSVGDFIGRTHFEVRWDENNAIPRSSISDERKEITIYPNPVNGEILYVENLTTKGIYTIFGIDGKTHVRGRYSKDEKSLDISALNKGVYFIRFARENGEVETKKLVKI